MVLGPYAVYYPENDVNATLHIMYYNQEENTLSLTPFDKNAEFPTTSKNQENVIMVSLDNKPNYELVGLDITNSYSASKLYQFNEKSVQQCSFYDKNSSDYPKTACIPPNDAKDVNDCYNKWQNEQMENQPEEVKDICKAFKSAYYLKNSEDWLKTIIALRDGTLAENNYYDVLSIATTVIFQNNRATMHAALKDLPKKIIEIKINRFLTLKITDTLSQEDTSTLLALLNDIHQDINNEQHYYIYLYNQLKGYPYKNLLLQSIFDSQQTIDERFISNQLAPFTQKTYEHSGSFRHVLTSLDTNEITSFTGLIKNIQNKCDFNLIKKSFATFLCDIHKISKPTSETNNSSLCQRTTLLLQAFDDNTKLAILAEFFNRSSLEDIEDVDGLLTAYEFYLDNNNTTYNKTNTKLINSLEMTWFEQRLYNLLNSKHGAERKAKKFCNNNYKLFEAVQERWVWGLQLSSNNSQQASEDKQPQNKNQIITTFLSTYKPIQSRILTGTAPSPRSTPTFGNYYPDADSSVLRSKILSDDGSQVTPLKQKQTTKNFLTVASQKSVTLNFNLPHKHSSNNYQTILWYLGAAAMLSGGAILVLNHFDYATFKAMLTVGAALMGAGACTMFGPSIVSKGCDMVSQPAGISLS